MDKILALKIILVLQIVLTGCFRMDYKKEAVLCQNALKNKVTNAAQVVNTEVEDTSINCKEKCLDFKSAQESNLPVCKQCLVYRLPFNGETTAIFVISGDVNIQNDSGTWETYSYYCSFVQGVLQKNIELYKGAKE
jgi:hypothetical protein